MCIACKDVSMGYLILILILLISIVLQGYDKIRHKIYKTHSINF
jgi:hypothetical protein